MTWVCPAEIRKRAEKASKRLETASTFVQSRNPGHPTTAPTSPWAQILTMSRFVRNSKYRHVFADRPKKEHGYENVKVRLQYHRVM